MIYWQALWGGLPHFRSGNASASHNELTAGWPLVLQDEESQLFSRGSSVLCLIRNEAGIEIQAAALAEEELARLWRSLGMEA